MTIQEEKQTLRARVAELKKSYTPEALQTLSADVLRHAEQSEAFRQAACIALYHAIPGEVQTAAFIEKWYRKKEIALPIVTGNELKLFLYRGKEALRQGAFGIWEPDGCCPETDEKAIGCILVPGIAFDRAHNRMGRGKGYYDRLLQTVAAPKIGLAFHFQVFDRVPVDSFDRKMDYIATDRELF